MKIIVTGAAGHLGRLAAEELLVRIAPEDLILVTRHPQALHHFRARGVDVRHGDFDAREGLPDAFAGGDRMLLISTNAIGRRIWQHRGAIEAAAAAGVQQVVFTSHVKPLGNPQGAFAQELGATEGVLQRSGLAWTILRFQTFAELQLPPAATAAQNGRLITNGGNGRLAPVARRDCAEAAAVTLTSDGHAGRTYDITGPEAFSPRDLAALYSDVCRRPIKFVQLTDRMLTGVLMGVGTPWPSARAVTAFGRAVRLGYFDVVDPAFEQLTGRTPTALREVLLAHRAEMFAVA
jgi:NAD(P)H dehydrogenase (quinone)